MKIKRADVFRATLEAGCGNVGFLGFAPDGSEYHVVVPVDHQIARGVKAGNRPDDGTPFGGYKGWRYFECPTWSESVPGGRNEQVDINLCLVEAWATGWKWQLEIEE